MLSSARGKRIDSPPLSIRTPAHPHPPRDTAPDDLTGSRDSAHRAPRAGARAVPAGGVRGRGAAGAVAVPRHPGTGAVLSRAGDGGTDAVRAIREPRAADRGAAGAAVLRPRRRRAALERRGIGARLHPLAALRGCVRARLLLPRGGVRHHAARGRAADQAALAGRAGRAVPGRAGDGADRGGDRGAALSRRHVRHAAPGHALARRAGREQCRVRHHPLHAPRRDARHRGLAERPARAADDAGVG